MQMSIIEMTNVNHCFADGTCGLVEVNLAIKEGELVVIAGKNGSGKTTLLHHLNGLLLPDSGTVKVDGVSVPRDIVRARQVVGMVFQNADSQIVGETVFEDVAFGPENLCIERREIDRRVRAALDWVGLDEIPDARPHLLSGGEKRRLSIAGILAMEPKIIVLDEPFSSLDYPGVVQVLEQVLSLHRAGRTILIVTHDLEKVIAHADRLIIMCGGRIVRDGPPESTVKAAEGFGVREPCASRFGLEVLSWLS
jgi:biotin transport system ATP-binding protein